MKRNVLHFITNPVRLYSLIQVFLQSTDMTVVWYPPQFLSATQNFTITKILFLLKVIYNLYHCTALPSTLDGLNLTVHHSIKSEKVSPTRDKSQIKVAVQCVHFFNPLQQKKRQQKNLKKQNPRLCVGNPLTKTSLVLLTNTCVFTSLAKHSNVHVDKPVQT